jgi:hypothetical protein
MYMVYWTYMLEQYAPGWSPQHKHFGSDEMSAALKFMEDLRKQQREDGSVGFVTFVSENPNSVGKPGVDETGADYSWTKRRSTALRKDVLDEARAQADDEEFGDQ